MPLVWQLLLAIAVDIAGYLLTPKPSNNTSAEDIQAPTAESGKTMTVIFGTRSVKSPNVLWFGNKQIRTFKVKA